MEGSNIDINSDEQLDVKILSCSINLYSLNSWYSLIYSSFLISHIVYKLNALILTSDSIMANQYSYKLLAYMPLLNKKEVQIRDVTNFWQK